MPQRKALPTETNNQCSRPLNEQDRIDAALNRMAMRLNKVLSASVINQWHSDLASFPLQGIEYAADWCGEELTKWPTWRQFKDALHSWMGVKELDASTAAVIPSREEIERKRREHREWLNSPEAKDVRAAVRKLDDMMNMGRPKLYTEEQLEQFRKERR